MISQTQIPEDVVTEVTEVPILLRLCDGLRDCLHVRVRKLTCALYNHDSIALYCHSIPLRTFVKPNKLSKLQIIRCKLSIARRKQRLNWGLIYTSLT